MSRSIYSQTNEVSHICLISNSNATTLELNISRKKSLFYSVEIVYKRDQIESESEFDINLFECETNNSLLELNLTSLANDFNWINIVFIKRST